MSNRTLERVLTGDYLADLDTLAVDAIRQKRYETQRLEDASSYLRRLVQGRLDVIGLEIRARASDERTDLSAIVDQPYRDRTPDRRLGAPRRPGGVGKRPSRRGVRRV